MATSQIEEGILIDALYLWCIRCNADSHELFEKIFCIAVTSASVERGFSNVDYRKSPDRSPRLLSVQFALTLGLYPGPGVYPGPGFYPGIYGIHAHRARVGNKLLSELVVI